MIITPWPPVTNVWRMNWYVGRPKNSWRRGTISELQVINTTWEETKRKVQDRTRWKETVDTLCPPWDEVEKSVSHVLPCLINSSSTSHINKQSSWLTLFMTIIPPPFVTLFVEELVLTDTEEIWPAVYLPWDMWEKQLDLNFSNGEKMLNKYIPLK